MSKKWELVISAPADAVCADCASYAGTYTVQWTTACHFEYVAPSDICSQPWKVVMAYSEITSWEVQILIGATYSTEIVNWQLSGTFDCSGSNDFAYGSSNGQCGSWQTTVTASPV